MLINEIKNVMSTHDGYFVNKDDTSFVSFTFILNEIGEFNFRKMFRLKLTK